VLCFAADTWIHIRCWMYFSGRTYQVLWLLFIFILYTAVCRRRRLLKSQCWYDRVGLNPLWNTIKCEYWSTISVLISVKADEGKLYHLLLNYCIILYITLRCAVEGELFHLFIVLIIIVYITLHCTVVCKLFNLIYLYLLFACAKQATYLYLYYTVHS
jgi:hypothetical protein